MTIEPVTAEAAYNGVRRRVTTLLGGINDAMAAATPVPACPDWTVVDVAGHLCGVCVDILAGHLDGVGTAPWADAQAAALAPLGLAAILARWEEVGPQVEALVPHFGPSGAGQFVFDATTHEHDLREGLGSSDARDTEYLVIPLGFLSEQLDRFVRSNARPTLRIVAPDGWTTVAGEGDPDVVLAATTFDVFRSFGGRRSLNQIRALGWSGDPEPYLSIFDESALTPPTRDPEIA